MKFDPLAHALLESSRNSIGFIVSLKGDLVVYQDLDILARMLAGCRRRSIGQDFDAKKSGQ